MFAKRLEQHPTETRCRPRCWGRQRQAAWPKPACRRALRRTARPPARPPHSGRRQPCAETGRLPGNPIISAVSGCPSFQAVSATGYVALGATTCSERVCNTDAPNVFENVLKRRRFAVCGSSGLRVSSSRAAPTVSLTTRSRFTDRGRHRVSSLALRSHARARARPSYARGRARSRHPRRLDRA